MNKDTANTASCGGCGACKPTTVPRLVVVKIDDTKQANVEAVPDVLRANLALMGVKAEVFVPSHVSTSEVNETESGQATAGVHAELKEIGGKLARSLALLKLSSEGFGVLVDLNAGILRRMIALDAGLTGEEVRNRYDAGDDGLEHPYGSRDMWREDANEGLTDLGYWDWIVDQLNNHKNLFEAASPVACDQEAEQATATAPDGRSIPVPDDIVAAVAKLHDFAKRAAETM